MSIEMFTEKDLFFGILMFLSISQKIFENPFLHKRLFLQEKIKQLLGHLREKTDLKNCLLRSQYKH